MSRYNDWLDISGDISSFIAKMESHQFKDMNDRHSLVKITKKLYKALEIADKAVEKCETE